MTEASPVTLHELPVSVDLVAMAVGAAFGAHIARLRHVPIFGVLAAGMIAGLAGAMTRDVLLGLEPAAIANWYYIPTVLIAAIVGGSFAHRVSFDRLPFVGAQAIAFGLLIAIGVQKGVEYRAPAPSAILLGIITPTFGGALEDVLTGRRAMIMREGPWLLSIIVLGAAIFWLFTVYVGFYPGVVVTLIVVVTLRILSVKLGWTTPVFPDDDHSSDDP